MLKLAIIFDKEKKTLVDMETGEIYAETSKEIQNFLIKHENNYTLQAI